MRRRSPPPAGVLVAVLLLLAGAPPARAARWSWSGSVVVDHKILIDAPENEAPLAKTGTVIEWSQKATVDVSERVTVSGRLCTACHGLTVSHAFAEFRFAPTLNVEAGRIEVPFGDFTLRHDPASDVFLSKPLPYAMGHMLRYQSDRFNLGVVPMPYVDEGASVFGDVWIREQLQIWWAAYAVNGFQAANGRDFAFKNQLGDGGYSDNNDHPSWGSRLALARGPLTAGASYLHGAYDPDELYEYEVWGVDASAYVRSVQFRAEYLSRWTQVDDDGVRDALDKSGFYVQAEAPVHPNVLFVARLDGVLREGPPLSTDNDESSAVIRWTVGLNVTPALDWSARLQFEHWRFTDFVDTNVARFGLVTTY